MIKAETCANLSWRSYFDRELYDKFITDCQLMKETAEKLHDMEIRRLQLLEICEDILDCYEYDEVAGAMESIVEETTEKRKSIYGF